MQKCVKISVVIVLSVVIGVFVIVTLAAVISLYTKQQLLKNALSAIMGTDAKNKYAAIKTEPMITDPQNQLLDLYASWIVYEFSQNTNVKPDQLDPIITLTYPDSTKPVIGTVYAYKKNDATKNLFVVVFRGTQTKKEVKIDLNFSQTSVPGGGMFHTGFWNVFQSLQGFSEFIQKIQTVPNPRILVCGHSLGCALTVLTTWSLRQLQDKLSNKLNVQAVLFASPRICDPEFARLYASLDPQTIRYENTEDFVPQLPLAVMFNLTTPTKPWLYSHVGNPLYFSDGQASLSLNHSMVTYQQFVNQLTPAPP